MTLCCQPALAELMKSLQAADEVLAFGQGTPPKHFDFWAPLFSLPYHFATRLDTIPAGLPYLTADPKRISKWRRKLPHAGRNVGLVWQGNPAFVNDGQRSIFDPQALKPLGKVAGINFVSLQKGLGDVEREAFRGGASWVDLGDQLEDFADTAAVLSCLDLTITVDTAAAHLAGALGRPCWVMLPDYMTDWRWLIEREDSPWYPEVMRLFRQTGAGDWPNLVEEVTVALSLWGQQTSSSQPCQAA